LLKIALTLTYLPPIWPMTFAYWLSAPTAGTTPVFATAATPEQADEPDATARQSTTAFARLRPLRSRRVIPSHHLV
jgi:hypothetical protein